MAKKRTMKDGRIRSFNLSTDAISKLNRAAEIEGVSRSAYIERLIVMNDHASRVKIDIDRGHQSTLVTEPTPIKPHIPKNLRCLRCPSPLRSHLRYEGDEWTAKCTNVNEVEE